MPRSFDINLRLSETSFLLYGLPKWNALMRLPINQRIAAFADPKARAGLVEATNKRILSLLLGLRLGDTCSARIQRYEGRRLADIAHAEGKSMPEALLDVAVIDELQTEFQLKGAIHGNPDETIKILDQPLIHIGASDAGAHASQFCGAGDTSELLERFVRKLGKMTLERAAHGLTRELTDARGNRQSWHDRCRQGDRSRPVRRGQNCATRGGIRLRFSRRGKALPLPLKRHRPGRRKWRNRPRVRRFHYGAAGTHV